MIYITGDCHGDFSKFDESKNCFLNNLTQNDYIIVCGDMEIFAVIPRGQSDEYWIEYLSKKKYTILFIDGNHENFDKLLNIPEIELFGGKVGKISENIYHLKRGEIYLIDGYSFFTFGGAISTATSEGTPPELPLWDYELPTNEEMNYGISNLKKYHNNVDFVITHTIPQSSKKELYEDVRITDPTEKYLENIYQLITFKRWFSGHHHMDKQICNNISILYHNFEKLDSKNN